MKTLTFKYLKLFLLAVAMINLTSCEIEIDDFYDDDNIGGSYYNKSLDLCSRPWADTFYDADGNYCYQELKIISGWNIPTDVIPNRCTPLPGIGRTVRNTPFGWYMVPVMSLISTMSGFGGMC